MMDEAQSAEFNEYLNETPLQALRRELGEYQSAQNAVNLEVARTLGALGRLDDYRGQQIAQNEHRTETLAAALRAFYRDPSETAEAILRSVDDD